jgi:hypothetical protein
LEVEMPKRRPEKPAAGKEILTRSEAAYVASCSVYLLDNLAMRGGGPKSFIQPGSGHAVHYHLRDVLEWSVERAARRAGALPAEGGAE